MAAFEEIAKILEEWGEDLVKDLRENLDKELSRDHKRVQEPKLKIEPILTVDQSGVRLQIEMDDYWKYVESGRRKGARQPPSEALGKKWQNQHNINARQILLDIRKKKGIKAPKKTLNYDKSAKTLAFIFARSIKKKGIRSKPFVKPTISDGRIEELRIKLAEVLKRDFEITLSF